MTITVDGSTSTITGATSLVANTAITGTLGVSAATTLASTLAVNGNAVTTTSASMTAFAGATTALTIGGTGATAVTAIPGTLDWSTTTGALTVAGGVYIAKKLQVVSDFSVATNKLTVAAASGNTLVAGTLAVNGNAITTSSASMTALAGATTLLTLGGTGATAVVAIPGTLEWSGTTGALTVAGGVYVAKKAMVIGDFAVATNKFTVAAASGNTLAAGTLTATGAFGCNAATAQTAFASGGALATYGAGANGFDSGANASALHALVVAIRAALVANGIMS